MSIKYLSAGIIGVLMTVGSASSFAVDSGLEYTGKTSFSSASLGGCFTWTKIKRINLTTPAANGYVKVEADGQWYNSKGGQNDGVLGLRLKDVSGPTISWNHYFASPYEKAVGSPNNVGQKYREFNLSSTIASGVTGTKTYELQGCAYGGALISGSIYIDNFSATWVPKRY